MTSGKFATTVGYERRTSPSLRIDDLERFVAHMNADQPPRPANHRNIVAINQGHRPLTRTEPHPPAIGADDARILVDGGHLLLDTRPVEAFGLGHGPGAFSIQLASPEFEQRVGWILPPDEPVLLVADSEAAAMDAALRLAFVGLDQRVAGYLEAPDWSRTGLPSIPLPQIDVATLRERLEAGRIVVVDVREPAEWRSGHIESAHGVSVKVLPQRWGEIPFPGEKELAVICGSGGRSSTAASVLLRHGFRNVVNVIGGMGAWKQAGYPIRS